MIYCLFIAGIIGLCDAVVAVVAWAILSRRTSRPVFLRAVGSAVGASAGAWGAGHQLESAMPWFGLYHESAQLTIMFAYPISLPVTTGLATWLLAEVIGGRGPKPAVTVAVSMLGALLGTCVIFLPWFFVRGFEVSFPIMIGVPIACSVLAFLIINRRLALSPSKAVEAVGRPRTAARSLTANRSADGTSTMTEARFRMNRLLKLPQREGVFVCGDVLEGVVAEGMVIDWPIHGDALMMTVAVGTVDYLDLNLAAGKAEVALGVRFLDETDDEEEFLRHFLEPGMVVTVRDPDSGDR
jgi:hypothetical protein